MNSRKFPNISIRYTRAWEDSRQFGIGIATTAGGLLLTIFGGGSEVLSGGASTAVSIPAVVSGIAVAGSGLAISGSALANMFDVRIQKSESSKGSESGKNAGESGTREKTTTNLGNEIDITPSDNHTAVSENPGVKGNPNSSVDILDEQGNVIARRWYDANGNAYRDVDMTNHGNSKTHPEYPHEHMWEWSDGIPRRSK